MNDKVSMIEDRYELTMVIIYRGDSPTGRIYHLLTKSSKYRIAKLITRLFNEQKIEVRQFEDNPRVYQYHVKSQEATIT